MVSAVKVGGQRLHELAREGDEVERAPRPVTVHRIDVEAYSDAGRVPPCDVECCVAAPTSAPSPPTSARPRRGRPPAQAAAHCSAVHRGRGASASSSSSADAVRPPSAAAGRVAHLPPGRRRRRRGRRRRPRGGLSRDAPRAEAGRTVAGPRGRASAPATTCWPSTTGAGSSAAAWWSCPAPALTTGDVVDAVRPRPGGRRRRSLDVPGPGERQRRHHRRLRRRPPRPPGRDRSWSATLAAARGLETAVVTFDRHPAAGRAARLGAAAAHRPRPEARAAGRHRRRLHAGRAPSTRPRSQETAEDFVTEVLVDVPRTPGSSWSAHDFHFGHGRRGNVALLRSMGADARLRGGRASTWSRRRRRRP